MPQLYMGNHSFYFSHTAGCDIERAMRGQCIMYYHLIPELTHTAQALLNPYGNSIDTAIMLKLNQNDGVSIFGLLSAKIGFLQLTKVHKNMDF